MSLHDKDRQPQRVFSMKKRKKLNCKAWCTPWANSFEFDSVGAGLLQATALFDPNNTHINRDYHQNSYGGNSSISSGTQEYSSFHIAPLTDAIHRVTMWRRRAESCRLPHSIETTASLAEILLHDTSLHYPHFNFKTINNADPVSPLSLLSTASIMTLRLSYASAIIRGVNGIADSMQRNRSSIAASSSTKINVTSVSSLCSRLGFPSWIVDVRHDSAHSELPTLPTLRLAAKAFLGFLAEKYWFVLRDKRIRQREEAMKFLVDYTREISISSVLNDKKIQGYHKDYDYANSAEEEEEDEEGEESKWIFGKYSILSEPTRSYEEKTKTKKRRKVSSPSPVRHIDKFLKLTPIDVGMSVVMSYLVWGWGDDNTCHGVLIPTVTEIEEEEIDLTVGGMRKLRKKFDLVLTILATAWSGFTHALILNIVEFMLILEQNGSNHNEAGGDEEMENNLFFLRYWFQYLLSNEFHAITSAYPSNQGNDPTFLKSVELLKKNERDWTKEERRIMEDSAPLLVLRMAWIPLNSLCDRCIIEAHPGGYIRGKIVPLLKDILGSERVEGFGFGLGLKSIDDRDCDGVKLNNKTVETHEKDLNHKEFNREVHPMTLEQMESMLLDESSNTKCDHDDSNDSSEVTNTNAGSPTESILKSSTEVPIARWSLCKDWEPCKLGTIPGYLS